MRYRYLAILLCAPLAAAANPLTGTRQVSLLEPDGTPHPVAEISFTENEGGYDYALTWNEAAFADHFLSMRPFRCLEGPAKHWCRVPYPYENQRRVTADDLTDLEYDLLFVWKGATEYGVNLWNGVYYRLAIDGERLTGQIHEFDVNLLAAPPEEGDLRPLKAGDLHLAEPESHWLPGLVIE